MNEYISIAEKVIELAADGFVKKLDNQFYVKAERLVIDFRDRTMVATTINKKEIVIGRLTSSSDSDSVSIGFESEMLLPITIR